MTTSHAPATFAKTTIEPIGKAMPTSRRARSALREDAPATFGQLVMVDRQRGLNNGVSQPNSGRNGNYQSGFAVIASHTLNSHSSQRLCARLARNRVITVARSSLAVRRACAQESIVLLVDSATGLGRLAVVATPLRTRPTQNATGSSASIP
jgi:hypothetical protein